MSDNMRRRAVQVELLEAPAGEGRVRALVTTFDRAYGIGPRTTETIGRGTFADGPVPIYFQHGHGDVPVGDAMATAGERGTELDVQFYLDTERGRACYRAQKSGALKEWSVGFVADNDDIVVTRAADGAVNEHIAKGDLLEVSVVLRGANPNTQTLEVRAEAVAVAAELDAKLAVEDAIDAEVTEPPASPSVPAELLARMGEAHVRAYLSNLVH